MAAPAGPKASEGRCPRCSAPLDPPVSGEVQCYVYCRRCRERFDPWDAIPDPVV